MIMGSVKFAAWSHQPVHAFHSVYLVYFILNWCSFAAIVIVTSICILVERHQRHRSLALLSDPSASSSSSPSCCCSSCCDCCCPCCPCCPCCGSSGSSGDVAGSPQRECCGRCHRCCLGRELDTQRQRINNSCCCDGCCPCCIDCCIDCCGEQAVALPENLADSDVVLVAPNHRVIYAPDPDAPVTLSNDQPVPIAELAGVGSADRHFVYQQDQRI